MDVSMILLRIKFRLWLYILYLLSFFLSFFLSFDVDIVSFSYHVCMYLLFTSYEILLNTITIAIFCFLILFSSHVSHRFLIFDFWFYIILSIFKILIYECIFHCLYLKEKLFSINFLMIFFSVVIKDFGCSDVSWMSCSYILLMSTITAALQIEMRNIVFVLHDGPLWTSSKLIFEILIIILYFLSWFDD